MIGVVDYGLGNVQAIINIYKDLDIPVVRFNDPLLSSSVTRLILPGVGAFDWAMQKLEHSGLRSALDNLVLKQNKPVLGICVGMQIMADRSEEGYLSGLGWIPGDVKIISPKNFSYKTPLPHMGWNDVNPIPHPLFDNIVDPRFYFLHSYYFSPLSSEYTLAEVEYGTTFTAAVSKGTIMGVQFHPEKSHHWGYGLLKNFAYFPF